MAPAQDRRLARWGLAARDGVVEVGAGAVGGAAAAGEPAGHISGADRPVQRRRRPVAVLGRRSVRAPVAGSVSNRRTVTWEPRTCGSERRLPSGPISSAISVAVTGPRPGTHPGSSEAPVIVSAGRSPAGSPHRRRGHLRPPQQHRDLVGDELRRHSRDHIGSPRRRPRPGQPPAPSAPSRQPAPPASAPPVRLHDRDAAHHRPAARPVIEQPINLLDDAGSGGVHAPHSATTTDKHRRVSPGYVWGNKRKRPAPPTGTSGRARGRPASGAAHR